MPCVRAHCHSDFRSTVASHQTFVKPQTPTSWLRLSAEHCKGCAKFLKAWEMAFKMYSCVPSASPVYSYYLKDLDQIINIRKHSIFFFKSLLTTLRTECRGMLPIPFENYQREAQSGFFFFFLFLVFFCCCCCSHTDFTAIYNDWEHSPSNLLETQELMLQQILMVSDVLET